MYKKILCLSVLVWGIFVVISPTLAAEKWYEYYHEAKIHIEAGEWIPAIEFLEKAIAEEPAPGKLKAAGWMKRIEYYPYLDLGMAYLAAHDIYFAAYYCVQAKAKGVAPPEKIEQCLKNIEANKKLLRDAPSISKLSEFPAFPWPPPESSTFVNLPSQLLPKPDSNTSLKEMSERFELAFDQAGYTEKSYYHVPGGFALVTRLEQFYSDGRPKELPDRWAVDISPPTIFSLTSYLEALFTAQEGHYRIIVFVVTSVPFSQGTQKVRRDEVIAWLHRGAQILPLEIGMVPYSIDHYCTALIYEFEQKTRDHEPRFKSSSVISGQQHLEKATIWGNVAAFMLKNTS